MGGSVKCDLFSLMKLRGIAFDFFLVFIQFSLVVLTVLLRGKKLSLSWGINTLPISINANNQLNKTIKRCIFEIEFLVLKNKLILKN